MSIGPSLPPDLAQKLSAGPQPSSSTLPDDSDSDDYGPALPPDLAHERSSRPILGPTLPPGLDRNSAPMEKRETPLSNAYSDDSDDDVGPRPIAAGTSGMTDGVSAFRAREKEREDREKEERDAKANNKLERESWMLVPPKDSSLLSTMDPTKLKSRGFNTSTKPKAKSSSSDVNLWTETPAQRQQRLEDEVMGRKRKAADVPDEDEDGTPEEREEKRRRRERDRKLQQEVSRHNREQRNESLLDKHSTKRKAEPKDKDPPAFWDRDRDMGVSGKVMGEKQRGDAIRNAKDLGGRFGGGSYL